MPKATASKQNLTILARVDGAGNVSSEVKKINSSIASVAGSTKGTTEEAGALSKAFDVLGKNTAQLNDKLMGMRTKDVSAELRNLGGALSLIPGPVGMVALAVTSVIGVFSTLKDLLAEDVSPATEHNKDQVLDLAGAYEALGDAASIAGAEEKIAADAALKEAREQTNEIYAQVKAEEGLAEAAQKTIDKNKARLKALSDAGVHFGKERQELEKQNAHLAQQVIQHNAARDSAQAQLEMAVQQVGIEKERLKGLTALAEEQRKQAQYAEEQAKKAAADAESRRKEQEANAKAAAERARQQTKAEIDAVENYRKSALDAVWAAEGHSAQESIEREHEARRKSAEETIKNAERLAEALGLIDLEYYTKKQEQAKKDAEADQKMREEIAKHSSDVLGSGEDPELKRINAQLAQLQADRAKMLELSGDDYTKYGELLKQTNDAILASENAKAAREQELFDEELQRINEEDARVKKSTYDRVYAAHSLTEAQKAAVDAQTKALDSISGAMEQWGAGSQVITAAQMTASGIQAAADAIDFAAQSVASFAIGNVGAGVGLAAAAAGKTAAAAAYAKGLLDLGFSAPNTASDSSATAAPTQTASTSSLTGSKSSDRTQEINVTMQFSGQAGRLGRYLIEDINAEARTAGGARINSAVLRG